MNGYSFFKGHLLVSGAYYFATCFFFFIYFYLLEANYFTVLYWILSYIVMNQPWSYMHSPSRSPLPPPSPPDSSRSSQCTRHLSHASHPRLLAQSPKVCCVHLCLFFCFAYRVIITIFLNSIYMC